MNKKEMHDLQLLQCIATIGQDEAVYNMITRTKFVDGHHAYAILKEEVEEALDEISKIVEESTVLWETVKADKEQETIERFKRVALNSKLAIHELFHVYSVALKAVAQLGESNGNEK